MKAHATVVAERGGRCTTLRSDPPITLRRTPEGLHIVGSAAGPVGGDDTAFDISLTAGAALDARTVAAQLVYPGPRREPSHASMRVSLASGASLRWLPEPVIAVQGADHRTVTEICMAAGASLVWREIIVLGRHREPAGSVRQRLRVERCGRAVLCTDVMLGPAWPHAAGPAGTGGSRVIAMLLVIGPAARDVVRPVASAGIRCGTFELAEDACLVSVLAQSVDQLPSLSS